MHSIAIIGGGITGVTTAYSLLNRGFRVSLFERHRYAAMETSFANGGQLSASNAEVWNHPSTILKGIKWMLRGDAPLLVRPYPSWHKLSWFAEFIANIHGYEENTVKSARLAIAARDHMFSWAEREGIDFDLKKHGILHIYRDRRSFEHAARVNGLLGQGGLRRREVTPAEMNSIEPTLAGTYYGGFFTESDSTGDIHKFTNGLADACLRKGGTFHYEHCVTNVVDHRGKVHLTARSENELTTSEFDAVVICAGTGSRALGARLGDRINVYPVKGYSITVDLPDAHSQVRAPQVSLLDDEAKIVTSRLGARRLRVAGTAEFAGFDYDIRMDRIAPLIRWVNRCFPDVSTRQVIPWAGLRPMMPNMLPRVGPGRCKGVFYNTGHGHLGWTFAAATAELAAEAISSARQG